MANEGALPSGSDYVTDDARFQAIFSCVPECVKRIGRDGRLIDMNAAGLRMIDAAAIDDVRGLSVLDLIDPAYHRPFREAIATVFQGKSVQLQFEVIGFGGRRLWMDQSAAPLFDRNDPGKVLEMVAVTRDFTAQRAAEADLLGARVAEEVARSQSRFLANIGNELKTPLDQVIGYGELLKESASDQGRQEDLADAERVLEAASRLLSMINQMLAVSLEDARRGREGVAAFELGELIDDAAAALGSVLHAAGTQVVVDLKGAPRIWTGDGRKLDHCLRSVLSAAAEYAGHGSISIGALAVFDGGCPQLQIDISAAGVRGGLREPKAFAAPTGSEAKLNSAHDVSASALQLALETARLMGGELKVSPEASGARLMLRVPARPATGDPLIVSVA